MSGTGYVALPTPVTANPQFWNQGLEGLNALRDYQAKQATAQIYQQSIDPNTGQIDQGKFNALLAANPRAAWNAGPTMQQQGQAQGAQAQGSSEQITGRLAQLKVMSGEMTDLLQSGQPVTADQVRTRLNSLGQQGIITPAAMQGVLADLATQPPGADLSGWLRNHMTANQNATEQLQNVTSQPYHMSVGGADVVYEGNPRMPNYRAPGSVTPFSLTPEAATDIVTIQYPDNTTRQFTRQAGADELNRSPGAKIVPNAPSYEGTIQAHEGLTADARDPTTVGGFRPSTWQGFAAANPGLFQGMTPQQILAARSDPNLNRQGVTWLAQQNGAQLGKSGVPVTGQSLGIAHYVGADPAAAIMRAPDNAPVAPLVGPAAVAANPELATMTVGQMKARYANVPNPGFVGGPSGTQPQPPAPVASNAPAAPAQPQGGPPGVQMGGPPPAPPGGTAAASSAPYTGGGIGAALAPGGTANPVVIRGSPIPAGRIVGAIQAGRQLAQANPLQPGSGAMVAGPGAPATANALAPVPWGTGTVIGNYGSGPAAAPVATPAPSPAAAPVTAPDMQPGRSAPVGYTEKVKADVGGYIADQAAYPDVQTRAQNLAHAYEALNQLQSTTGRGAEGINALRSYAQTLGILPPGAVNEQRLFEIVHKYTERAMIDAAGANTDLGRRMQEQANAGTLLSSSTNLEILRNDMGKALQTMAAYKDQQDKTGAGYLDHRATVAENSDPRGFVWNLYSPQEKAQINAEVAKNQTAANKLHKAIGMAARLNLQIPGLATQ